MPSSSKTTIAMKKRRIVDDEVHKSAKKRQRTASKVPKDSAVFVEAGLNGPLNFPPTEHFSGAEAAEIEKYEITHLGQLTAFPRRIPYRRKHANLGGSTSQEMFNTLNFEFKTGLSEKPVVILWDYVTGMVRITPFFKVLGHGKTVPAQVIDRNHLREQAVSVTGGDIVAQGYWLPFETSKSLAATFCYEIRWALVPLFGADFPAKCCRPGDKEYQSMRLSPDSGSSPHSETSPVRRDSSNSGSATSAQTGDSSELGAGLENCKSPILSSPLSTMSNDQRLKEQEGWVQEAKARGFEKDAIDAALTLIDIKNSRVKAAGGQKWTPNIF